MIDTMRETVVFAYDAPGQRKDLLAMLAGMSMRDAGLRIVALSVDNEVTRVDLIQEAVERYSDHIDLVEAIEAVMQCEDVKSFTWAEHERQLLTSARP